MNCCFIGHRKIEESEKLINDLQLIIKDLIVNKGVSRFMFGSKSQFNDLCYDIVSELKNKYAHIVRIYVRSMYEIAKTLIESEKGNAATEAIANTVVAALA